MNGYDPDALNENAEQATPPEGGAVITDISETVANSVYGENVDLDDPTKVMIEVTAETSDEQEITEVFSLPENEASWYNPNFKLGQFRDKYGTVPEEGLEVETSMDDETGFYGIDY